MTLALLLLLAAAPSAEPFIDAAHHIEQAIQSGNAQALSSRFNTRALAERAIKDLEAPRGFRDGFLESAGKIDLAAQFAGIASNGGRIKLLRLAGDPGSPRALFRVIDADGGLNYYEMYLARVGDRVVVTDIYTFSNGERITETVRRSYSTFAAQADTGFFGKLLGKERDFVVNAEKVQALTKSMKEGRFEDVLKAYDALPDSLKKERTFLLFRMQAAANLTPELHELAVAEFERAYPGDPALTLATIDLYFGRKEFDRALATIDRLDARVKDPYLEVLRAGSYVEQGKYDVAKKRCRQAMAEEPELMDLYWSLVTVSLAAKDHAETARVLEQIEERFNWDVGDLTGEPEYAEFVKSGAYKAWMKRRAN
ncbi:MAG: hypothetical protein WBV82_05585 [Myxococcaceae bacterium]